MTSKRFDKKVVVITGAAQGIGEGVAKAVAKEGGIVVLVDRSELVQKVAVSIKRVKGYQGNVLVVQADLETYAGAQAVVDQTLAAFGKIDVLINNVGGTIWAKPLEEYTESQIEAEIRRSLFPTLWCCRAALPAMLKRKSGVIVNISSIATLSIHRTPYAAAKGGVNALTASLAFEYSERGIRVNAVATGGTEAPPRKIPRHPTKETRQEKIWYQEIIDQTIDSSYMHRYGSIEEQVSAILFLASDESSYITGTVLPVGGGDQG
ncbi:MAG: 1,6-dihydroxycyclohexa-2,4-diene-1-carboxylate dehydrogenase [Fluviibacter phosphoraccumulans]